MTISDEILTEYSLINNHIKNTCRKEIVPFLDSLAN